MKAGLAAILFVACGAIAPAQVLPSVDIDTARTQIDQFLQENEQIQERITSLLATNEELANDMETWKTWISGIDNVTEKVVEKANQLVDILSELASKSITERAQTVLDRYYRIKSVLDDKKNQLTERLHAAEASIKRNGAVIEELGIKIQSNLDNVELLKAAIERSSGSEEIVNGYIENLQKALDEAQEFLNQSF